MKTWQLLLASLVLIVGCVQKETTTILAKQERVSGHIFCCWFIVSDGAGHHGYQALDTLSSSATPQTRPLFKSIDKLRVALHRQGVKYFETIGGYTNGGWEIRGLTADELRGLR